PLIDYLLQHAKGKHRVWNSDPEPQLEDHGLERLRGNPQGQPHPALMAKAEVKAVYGLGGNRGEAAQPVVQPGLVPDPTPHQLSGNMIRIGTNTATPAWRRQISVDNQLKVRCLFCQLFSRCHVAVSVAWP